MARILSIGPDSEALVVRNRELELSGHDVRSAETRSDALALAGSEPFEFILLCDRFLPAYAIHLADELKVLAPAAMIIVLAGRAIPITPSEINALLSRPTSGLKAA